MRTDSSPSEISSSEIPDSSSSSINFFTLRMSIREPLEESLVLGVGQAGARGFERELIADGSQSDDAADRDVGQIRVVPKSFACEHVAEMHFDEGHGHREEGIAQGDTGVRVPAWIEDHERNAVLLGGLNLRNQLVLRIALEGCQGMALGEGEPAELELDALQTGGTVYLGFPGAEKIQVRTVQQQDSSHLASSPAPSRCKGPR